MTTTTRDLLELAEGEVPVEGVTSPEVIAASIARYQFAAGFVKGKRVLDVGCAFGRGSAQLADAGAAEVVGIDRLAEAVRMGRLLHKRRNLCLLAVAIEEYQPEGPFDVLVAFEVIEHCDDPASVLHRFRDWLRPGGLCIISTPNGERQRCMWARNPYHKFEWSASEFRERLSSCLCVLHLHGQGRIGPPLARRLRQCACALDGAQPWCRLARRVLRKLSTKTGYHEWRGEDPYPLDADHTGGGGDIPMALVAVCQRTAASGCEEDSDPLC